MIHLRILHAEDEVSIIETVSTILTAHAPACKIELELASVTTFEDFTRIAFDGWDAILLDLSFPDSGAVDTLTWLCANVTKLGAVIVITGSERDEHYYSSLECGALGFLLKPEFKDKHGENLKPRHMLMEIHKAVKIRQAIEKHYGTEKPPRQS